MLQERSKGYLEKYISEIRDNNSSEYDCYLLLAYDTVYYVGKCRSFEEMCCLHLQGARVVNKFVKRLYIQKETQELISWKNQLESWSFCPRFLIHTFLCLSVKSTPLWLPSPIGCLANPLFRPFVISASSVFPNCLQIYRTDGGSKFLRQRRVCIPNIPFLLRARST